MKKFLTVLSVALVLCFFSTNVTKAQLPDGAFGIGGSFANSTPTLSGMYSFSPAFDLALNLGYTSLSGTNDVTNTTTSTSETQISLGFRYFFVDNKRIDPFFGLGFGYGMEDNGGSFDPSTFGLNFMFGGQTQIAENFFVYLATGISYSSTKVSDNSSTSMITFGTTAVGAIIYFK
jgi:outer membrane protein with beta-barrel domain